MAPNDNTQLYEWQVKYSRCFTNPYNLENNNNDINNNNDYHPLLCPLKPSLFKPIWLSTVGYSTLSLLPFDENENSLSVLSLSLHGSVLEEHLISKLHFSWPQVSCMSGYPMRGSLVVLASFTDAASEKQKFALRFSTLADVEDFINTVEDILSRKVPDVTPPVEGLDAITAESSQSESIPPYRPDISSLPVNRSPLPTGSQREDQPGSLTQDFHAYCETNAIGYPPRFTSLVSQCSAEIDPGTLPLALTPDPGNQNLKTQIAKYIQDASFLDMLCKVGEVITELGEDLEL